jgi:hypothetical protein
LDITKDFSVLISASENHNLRVIESCCMSASTVRILSGWVDSDPSVLVHVEKVDIHENCGRLAPAYETEMRLIYLGGGVSGSRGRRWLPGHRWQDPGSSSNIKYEHVIEELVDVSSAKDIKAPASF